MGQYSIKDVELLTGIKAHTLRIWEQRYGMVIPHRTDTKIRFYDDSQLKQLLNISILLKNGKKISKISQMSGDEINTELKCLIKAPTEKDKFFETQIDTLVICMIDLDEMRFEKVISTSTVRYGFETTMLQVIIPFLEKVGIMWATDEINVAQEHFITNLIRRKLIVAIDAQIPDQDLKKKFILFLPEGELHEIGLLFAKYIIKSTGFRILYLGQTVPLEDVLKVQSTYNADYLLTYFTMSYEIEKMKVFVEKLAKSNPDKNIIVCGPMVKYISNHCPHNVILMNRVDELSYFLSHIPAN